MGRSGTVEQHRPSIACRKAKAALGKGGFEGDGGIRRLPGGERNGANIGNRNIGALGLGAFPRGLLGDRAATVEKPSGCHGICYIVAPVFPESGVNGAIMFPLHEGQAELKFRDPADFFAASVFMGKVRNLPVRSDQRVCEMIVRAPGLDMLHAAALNVLKPEFFLISHHEEIHDGFRVGTEWRIDVDMMDRAIGAPVPSCCDKFAKLPAKIGGREVPGVELTNLLTPAGQEMAGECGATCTSG